MHSSQLPSAAEERLGRTSFAHTPRCWRRRTFSPPRSGPLAGSSPTTCSSFCGWRSGEFRWWESRAYLMGFGRSKSPGALPLADMDSSACGCRYLLHDRDTKFTAAFDAILKAAGVEPVVLPPHSPNLNAYAEKMATKREGGRRVEAFDSLRRSLATPCTFPSLFGTSIMNEITSGQGEADLVPGARRSDRFLSS